MLPATRVKGQRLVEGMFKFMVIYSGLADEWPSPLSARVRPVSQASLGIEVSRVALASASLLKRSGCALTYDCQRQVST